MTNMFTTNILWHVKLIKSKNRRCSLKVSNARQNNQIVLYIHRCKAVKQWEGSWNTSSYQILRSFCKKLWQFEQDNISTLNIIWMFVNFFYEEFENVIVVN